MVDALGRSLSLVTAPDPAHTPWLFEEAKQLAQQSHPSIPTTYHYWTKYADARRGPGYLRRWITGETVRARLARLGLADIPYVFQLLRGACSTLSYLHETGIAHGGLNGDALWTTPTGRLWMLEWQWAVPRAAIPAGVRPGNGPLEIRSLEASRPMREELLPMPPEKRTAEMPWPDWPMIMRTSSSHEEGVQRDWSINTSKFSGENGVVKKLHGVRLNWRPDNGRMVMEQIPKSDFEIECDLVLLALGFLGPEPDGIVSELGLKLDPRSNVQCENYMSSVAGVFAAGDTRRGQSLVVWAIWEGREAARAVDSYLMGETFLPTSPDL